MTSRRQSEDPRPGSVLSGLYVWAVNRYGKTRVDYRPAGWSLLILDSDESVCFTTGDGLRCSLRLEEGDAVVVADADALSDGDEVDT